MFDLSNLTVPSQSNGKISFINLGDAKKRRSKTDTFQLKYVCEIKTNKDGNLEKKNNLIINKNFISNHTVDSFWTIGEQQGKVFAVKSIDGNYSPSKLFMKIWKGISPSTKVTSDGAAITLKKYSLIDDDTAECKLNLVQLDGNFGNCEVYEITAIDTTEKELEQNEVENFDEVNSPILNKNVFEDEEGIDIEIDEPIGHYGTPSAYDNVVVFN